MMITPPGPFSPPDSVAVTMPMPGGDTRPSCVSLGTTRCRWEWRNPFRHSFRWREAGGIHADDGALERTPIDLFEGTSPAWCSLAQRERRLGPGGSSILNTNSALQRRRFRVGRGGE
jgi:hypothetical protein